MSSNGLLVAFEAPVRMAIDDLAQPYNMADSHLRLASGMTSAVLQQSVDGILNCHWAFRTPFAYPG